MLDNYINISIIADNSLKVISKVVKCSPTEKYKTSDDINIFINEHIFDELTPELQKIAIDEALVGISFSIPVISEFSIKL